MQQLSSIKDYAYACAIGGYLAWVVLTPLCLLIDAPGVATFFEGASWLSVTLVAGALLVDTLRPPGRLSPQALFSALLVLCTLVILAVPDSSRTSSIATIGAALSMGASFALHLWPSLDTRGTIYTSHQYRPSTKAASASAHPTGHTTVEAELGLTPRECEVFGLLVSGYSLPFIAQRLGISARTADTHMRHIYQKAGVHTRNDLIDAFAARYNWQRYAGAQRDAGMAVQRT